MGLVEKIDKNIEKGIEKGVDLAVDGTAVAAKLTIGASLGTPTDPVEIILRGGLMNAGVDFAKKPIKERIRRKLKEIALAA